MSERPSSLKSGGWFPPEPRAAGASLRGAVVKLLIGLGAGLAFYAGGLRSLAWLVWALAGLIGLVSIASSEARGRIDRLFAALGRAVGGGLSWIILAPTYLIGFSALRLLGRLGGADPLHLRDGHRQSFWLASDTPARKLRHVRALFATERPTAGRRPWLSALVVLVALLGLAEVGLRIAGYGDPVLYRSDALAGYYPAPGQRVRRSGGVVRINAFGMRAPDYPAEKPAGTFRVLMLGDSTLYGGSYIDQPDLYARRLEGLLSEVAGGRPVQILNMGVNGWGPFQEAGYVERFGSFGADLAILCLPFGDLYRPFEGLAAQPYLPEGEAVHLALEEVLYHLSWRYRAGTLRAAKARLRAGQGEPGARAYGALAQRLQRAGAEVMVEVLPSEPAALGEVSPAEMEGVALLHRVMAPTNIPVAFPQGFLKGASADGGPLYHDWVHLHRGGHALYADYLRGRISAHSRAFAAFRAGPSAQGGGAP